MEWTQGPGASCYGLEFGQDTGLDDLCAPFQASHSVTFRTCYIPGKMKKEDSRHLKGNLSFISS